LTNSAASRGIPLIDIERGVPRDAAEFVNAGHLNDRGAKRYSGLLAERLEALWPDFLARLSR